MDRAPGDASAFFCATRSPTLRSQAPSARPSAALTPKCLDKSRGRVRAASRLRARWADKPRQECAGLPTPV